MKNYFKISKIWNATKKRDEYRMVVLKGELFGKNGPHGQRIKLEGKYRDFDYRQVISETEVDTSKQNARIRFLRIKSAEIQKWKIEISESEKALDLINNIHQDEIEEYFPKV